MDGGVGATWTDLECGDEVEGRRLLELVAELVANKLKRAEDDLM